MLYKLLIRWWLFWLSRNDPEIAHELVMRRLEWLQRHHSLCEFVRWWHFVTDKSLAQNVMGLHFPNPIGLAAGFDKNAQAPHAAAAAGFGFVELGAVVPKQQDGNKRPRTMRVPALKALRNRNGFNSDGMNRVEDRLAGEAVAQNFPVPLFINLGTNKNTPNDAAVEDYLLLLRCLHHYGDCFTINVSSPNKEGLRELQKAMYLRPMLRSVVEESRTLAVEHGLELPKRILVKVAPDLSDVQLLEVLEVCIDTGIDGVIIANTKKDQADGKQWGLSGRPIFPRALEMVQQASRACGGQLAIVASGGVDSVDRAKRMLEAGASLVQVLTGLFYEGPGLVKRINKGLLRELRRDGRSHVGGWHSYATMTRSVPAS